MFTSQLPRNHLILVVYRFFHSRTSLQFLVKITDTFYDFLIIIFSNIIRLICPEFVGSFVLNPLSGIEHITIMLKKSGRNKYIFSFQKN